MFVGMMHHSETDSKRKSLPGEVALQRGTYLSYPLVPASDGGSPRRRFGCQELLEDVIGHARLVVLTDCWLAPVLTG